MKILRFLALALLPISTFASAPSGYYNKCEGLNTSQLLRALEETISDHNQVGYNGLWSLYKTSDAYPDGKIWDMYSTKHWTYDREQCGTYSNVGDCYNREHSMPKSWFNDQYPMYCDAFHLYPTDGKVNGQRSNYPYGECANGTTLSAPSGIQALGKLGKSTFPGYSGTVFEPDDEYKGDFARSYFYMAACYNSLIDDWDSDMLAGNSYPAFTNWAVELLMKWHRQDPVSQKELDRQEVVYGKQHNRNPFIDYPEMAEYIWGNKKSENWSAGNVHEPAISKPIDGSVYDFGSVRVGQENSLTIPVKGSYLTADITITCENAWFTTNKSSISAAEANSVQGSTLELTWDPEEVGQHAATLVFKSGHAQSTISVHGVAVDQLTALPAKEITDRGFTASWIYGGDEDSEGCYEICYRKAQDSNYESCKARALAANCRIEGLDAATEYLYWVNSTTTKSNEVSFTTGDPIPYIQLLYDGTLYLQSVPGEPSEAYEILVDAENIDQDITISVKAPFELSSDKASWSQSLIISPEEDRFYMRIFSAQPGVFSTVIKLQSGTYVNDDIEVEGCVTDEISFVEDFEADAAGCDTYSGCEFNGKAAKWYLGNAGIWESDKNYTHSGDHCVRMGKTSSSYIEMTSDKNFGLGTVSLWARCWSSKEGQCTFHVEYSLDNGETWSSTTNATVDSEGYNEFAFVINEPGNGRIRIAQTQGARFIIDDVSISNYRNSGLEGVESDYHSWDAFCRGGSLVIESQTERQARVYGVDGIVYFEDQIASGTTTLSLPQGLYIVSIEDFARRVLVK